MADQPPVPAQSRSKILHVDDDEANRYAVTRSLMKAGFDVVEAATGQDALARMAENPDLVILDVRLPDMDGFEVCRRIKADPVGSVTPILHLSASFTSSVDKATGLDSGAEGYLVRPVEPVELIATVNALLRTKRVEEAFRESEARFRQLADAMPQMVWSARPNGSIDYFNERWYEFTGFERGTGGDASWMPLVHPDDRERARESWYAAVRSGERYQLEYRFKDRTTGNYRWFLGRALAARDEAGNVTRWYGTWTDIDDTKRADAAIREAEERLRLVMTSVKDHAIFTLSTGGVVTAWNVGAERIFGYSATEMIGHPPDVLFTPEDREAGRPQEEVKIAAAAGLADDHRFHLRRDGTRFFAAGSMEALRDEHGRLRGFVKVVRDVTEQRRVGEERERLLESERAARTEAEHVGRVKDEFLATLSHELRTPLNAMLGWAQILRRTPGASADPDQVATGLEIIERNARSQAQLIEDLLDMSRIISGKMRLTMGSVDLSSVLAAAIDVIRPSAEAKGVGVNLAKDPAIEPVAGDPARLQQVIWNLLSNAIKFTPRGGHIDVSLSRRGDSVELSIGDSGDGIRPEFLPHVFERFRQADASTTRRHGGLGLGLAIVKHLVELHGGTVAAASDGPGRGATFVVSLPTSSQPVGPPGAADPERVRPLPGVASSHPYCVRGGPTLKGVRVLILEDDPDSRELIRQMLEDCEALVDVAEDGKDALARLAGARVDVIVSDIGMPGMDGYEFMRRVRDLSDAEGGLTPAIALTAFARAEDRNAALRSGYQRHLSKPIDADRLVTACAELSGRTTEPA